MPHFPGFSQVSCENCGGFLVILENFCESPGDFLAFPRDRLYFSQFLGEKSRVSVENCEKSPFYCWFLDFSRFYWEIRKKRDETRVLQKLRSFRGNFAGFLYERAGVSARLLRVSARKLENVRKTRNSQEKLKKVKRLARTTRKNSIFWRNCREM